MRKTHSRTRIMARKVKNRGKWNINMVGPAVGQETLKKVENEKCTL